MRLLNLVITNPTLSLVTRICVLGLKIKKGLMRNFELLFRIIPITIEPL